MGDNHPRDPMNVEGRVFGDTTAEPAGDVGSDTVFEYHEEPDGTIWARYSGGSIRLGHLTGRRDNDCLTFRYAHIDSSGNTASGYCTSKMELLDDGRLRSRETWSWDSQPGEGTGVIEEIAI